MSHIMEKTLATLPKLLTQSLVGAKGQGHNGPTPLGQEVMNFMKTVHRAHSKTQESAIVKAELAAIKEKLKQMNLSKRSSSVLRNTFTKVIFCHLLGYDVSFVLVDGMKLCQQAEGYDKRLGYLVTCLLLHRDMDVAVLMLSTLLRDLTSSNMGDNWMALTLAGQLVPEDSIEHILPAVVNNLKHQHDMVREKAVHCLLAFHRIAPAQMQAVMPKLAPLLSSRDPGVLNALTNVYVCLSEENPSELVGLGGSFLHILHQIINRGFGSNFYYHMVPLPWLQINLLKVLGNLAAVDSGLCRSLCPILETLIERTKVTEPVSLAILMESVKTATKIKADDKLLELCSACVGKLLSSSAVNNMRYQGLGLLIALSKVRPGFAARHQVAVVECLNDPDDAIQARTTHLLHAMANGANVKAICEKLFEQSVSSDAVRRRDIIMMVSDLAERLVVDMSFYLHLYFRIFLSNQLNSTMRLAFVELVMCRVENFARTPGTYQEESVAQLARNMLDIVENEQTTPPNVLLALQVLGSLAPVLKSHSPIDETFLHTVRKYFGQSRGKHGDEKQCLLANPQVSKPQTVLKSSDVELQCTCLQVITKMVLAECLNAESVKLWLENLNENELLGNFQVRCYFNELLNLVSRPLDIALRADIMFTPNTSSLDLSLSFMDALIVRNMLQGKEGFMPRYKVLAERNASLVASLDASMLSSHLSDAEQTSADASLNTSMVMKVPAVSLAPSKWRDDDEEEEEQFTLVDVVEEGSPAEKTVGPERDLFAGLENINLEAESNVPSLGKHRSLWEDEKHDNDMTINIGFNLHPFGLPRKSRHGHQGTKWFDEDENDNPRLDDESKYCSTEFSNLSERCESPSNFSSNSIYSDFRDPSTLIWPSSSQSSLHKANSLSGAPSIYNQSALGYSPGSPGMSMSSTVDTLTDSDPNEESDDNGVAGTSGVDPQPL